MITDLRPPPKRKFDQFGVTEETLSARANVLGERGFLTDAKILFLGDYDLTSLACLPAQAGLPRAKNTEIWVLDIDPEVLRVVKEQSQGKVFTVQHDLSNPLPKKLLACFDAVFTDPPYTLEGVALFLSRSLDALTRGERARVFLSYSSLDPVRALSVQQKLLDHGVVIEELRPRFNEYLNAKTIGDSSDLYFLRPTPKFRPLVRGEYQGKIYTYE
ncbi:MAG: bis-aminopropyl spermidine synthase family protein [candidate division WWE3 bacterium]|nr:bis-aminopropyl spermidine synthase family protein [candidate division WWE3 bacterium]